MAPLFKRRPRQYRSQLFDDLPFEAQREAQERLFRYLQKWKRNLRRGIYPILVGLARRWTMTSQEERSGWGRSMLAKRGGYAIQRLYREQGRTGEKHPAHKAARVSAARRLWRKMDREEEQRRITLGVQPKTRHKVLSSGW